MTRKGLCRVRGYAIALTAALCVATATAAPRDIDPELLRTLTVRLAEPYESVDKYDTQVWFAASDQRLARYIKDAAQRLDILQAVFREANHHGLNPGLVMAVIQIESHFDRFAVSRVGAQGMMQVMPFWRAEIGREQDNLTHLHTNIRYGTAILAHYIQAADGDLVDALGRYNGSRGRLHYPEKVIAAWRKSWRNESSEDLPALQASCAKYPLRACRYQ